MPCNDCKHHSENLRLPWLHWSNSTHSFNAKAWLQFQFPDSGKLKSHKSLLQHFSSVVAFCRTAVFFANSIFCNSFSFRAKVKDQSITKSINKSCIFSTPPKNYNWSLIFFFRLGVKIEASVSLLLMTAAAAAKTINLKNEKEI